jgi:hypothetical protein
MATKIIAFDKQVLWVYYTQRLVAVSTSGDGGILYRYDSSELISGQER